MIEVWKKGVVRISGTRVKVPNHETYLYPQTEEGGENDHTEAQHASLLPRSQPRAGGAVGDLRVITAPQGVAGTALSGTSVGERD